MGFGLHLVGGSQGGFCRGGWPLRGPICEGRCPSALPHVWGYPPHTRGSFRFTTKGTKGVPEPTVLDSLSAKSPPFSRSLTHRAGLLSATVAEGFATLRWWGKLDAPSPWALSKRNILLSIRGAGAFSCTFGCNFGGIRGIGEGGFFETNRKRSGGNGGDGRRLNPIMSRTRNNLFIKFTASLEFVSG